MRDATRLTEDGVGRTKLEVSLPGGRYQLSLNDGAVNLYVDSLGLELGDVVPELTVPVVVATGDAWFPHMKDVDSIIDDLPTDGVLTEEEEAALEDYITTTWMTPQEKDRVLTVLEVIPSSFGIDSSQLQVKELPSLPDGIFDTQTDTEEMETVDADSLETKSAQQTASRPLDEETKTTLKDEAARSMSDADIEDHLQEIPGVGEQRAAELKSAGVRSVDELAEIRPSDLAAGSPLSYEMAMVVVEGANEIVRGRRPTAERLAEETGTAEQEFDAALSSLAASGVPPSEASSVLRILFGPTVADVDGVTGQQAYFLWMEGYRTPADLVRASVEDLQEVPQLGAKTAPKIRESAHAIVPELKP